MIRTELKEAFERMSKLIFDANNTMKELKQLAKDYEIENAKLFANEHESAIEENVKDYRLGCHISTLELPKNVKVRFRNACEWHEIETIGDLMKFGRNQFRLIRNVGTKLMIELDYALERQYNLKLV